MRIAMRLLALQLLLVASSCYNANQAFIQAPSDEWLVTGQIGDRSFFAKEILALRTDGARYRTSIKGDSSFAIQLPGNSLYAIYVIPDPRKNPTEAAILTFDDGSNMPISDVLRLPKPTLQPWLDLGSIDIKNSQAFPTKNPSRVLDYDQDSLIDMLDRDDQNDGVQDSKQQWQNQKVGICCFLKKDQNNIKSIYAPLATLLSHLQHGDYVGPCNSKKL